MLQKPKVNAKYEGDNIITTLYYNVISFKKKTNSDIKKKVIFLFP